MKQGILISLLAACFSLACAVPVVIVSPTAAPPVQLSPTQTSVLEMPTAAPVFTDTPIPTDLPAPTNVPAPTYTPVPSLAEFRDCKLYLNGMILLDLSGCFSDGEISYSPTREYFLLVVHNFEGDNDGYVFKSDGSNMHQMASFGDYINYSEYQWTPDGRYIIYSSIFSCCIAPPPGVLVYKTMQYDVFTQAKEITGSPNARPEPYKVVKVASNDVLNIREAPGVKYAIAGTIPPDSTGVKILGEGIQADNATWVPILYNGIFGWVNSHYLAQE